MKVKDLNQTLSKFTKGKENFDMILLSQRSSLNKTRLEFKFGRTHSKKLKERESTYL